MRRIALLLALLVLPAACAAPPATQPAGPVAYDHEVRANPPMHLHVLRIDLTDPTVSIVIRRAGDAPKDAGIAAGGEPWQTTLMTVRAIAARDDLVAAVNGDFFATKETREILGRKVAYFDGNPARVIGYAMSDGRPWSTAINNNWAALCVHGKSRVTIHQAPRNLPADVTQVVGGLTQILTDGRVTAKSDDRAPRTAAGVDKEGQRLVLLVVDGRRPEYSAGLNLQELAEEMRRLGCSDAINLDGGGSSTMVMRDPATGQQQLINRPSDGHDFVIPLSVERPVANVLGIRIGRPAEQVVRPDRGTATRAGEGLRR